MTGTVDGIGPDVIDLVHCLGFVYLRHGQPYRAVVLLIVAAQSAPERADVLRTLCGAMVAAGMGPQVMPLLDRLRLLAPDEADHPMMRLLHARALLLTGDVDAARAAFRTTDSTTSQTDSEAA